MDENKFARTNLAILPRFKSDKINPSQIVHGIDKAGKRLQIVLLQQLIAEAQIVKTAKVAHVRARRRLDRVVRGLVKPRQRVLAGERGAGGVGGRADLRDQVLRRARAARRLLRVEHFQALRGGARVASAKNMRIQMNEILECDGSKKTQKQGKPLARLRTVKSIRALNCANTLAISLYGSTPFVLM